MLFKSGSSGVLDKDLEILLLRQQLMLVRRKQKRGPTTSRFERLLLVTLVERLHRKQGVIRQVVQQTLLIFQPETILN
jgi:hypothetical protein